MPEKSTSRSAVQRARASAWAAEGGVATVVAGGTGIHCRDQLKTSREADGDARAGDHCFARLHRLAQYFQYAALKLRQLVQEQYAPMR